MRSVLNTSGVPRIAAFLAVVFLVAVTHKVAPHSHPVDAADHGPDLTWYWVISLITWIIAAIVGISRQTPARLAYVFLGWICGPLALLFSIIEKPQGPPAPPRVATPIPQPTVDPIITNWLKAIEEGNLPVVHPDGIMTDRGEEFIYQEAARYGQTYAQRVSQGGSPALYIPLGHGFRARVAGYSGTSQTVQNFAWGPQGMVAVSNLRIVFKANGTADAATAGYEKILSYECYPTGLEINVTGIGMMQFQTGNPILGAVFKKMVTDRTMDASRRAKAELQQPTGESI
jgi:hypothetical protein